MTEWRLKATLNEADDIAKGMKNFCFRASNNLYKPEDVVTFQPMKNGKMTRHPIEKMRFMVTYVSSDAPIDKGFSVIGFKRIAR